MLPKKTKNAPKTLFAAKLNKLRLPPKLKDANQGTDPEVKNETKQIQQVEPIKPNNELQKGKTLKKKYIFVWFYSKPF